MEGSRYCGSPMLTSWPERPVHIYMHFVCLFIYLWILFIYFQREWKAVRKKMRETLMWEGNIISCLSYALQLGTKPVTQAHGLTGNQTSNLLLCGMMPNQLSHTSQGFTCISDIMMSVWDISLARTLIYALCKKLGYILRLLSQGPFI